MKKTSNEDIWYYATIALIVFIIIGLTISFFNKKKTTIKSYDTAALENMIIEDKIEKITASESKSTGKIIPPLSRYDIDQLRQSLNLPEPEKEEEDIKRLHEEILKHDPRAQYIF